MNNDLYSDTVNKACEAVRSLLNDHKDGILAYIGQKIGSTQNSERSVKVGLAFPVTLSPMGDTCGVKVKIAYGEKVKDECESVADSTPELGIK